MTIKKLNAGGIEDSAITLAKIDIDFLDTDNIAEGANLYYTDARVYSNVTQLGLITSSALDGYATNNQIDAFVNVADLTTENVAEVVNLYYTDTRAYSNSQLAGYATTGYVTTAISNLIDSAPETLNTLNELASALGDDANFATTTATLIGRAYDQANAAYDEANTRVVDADLTTENVAEVVNLYYTDTRAYSNSQSAGYITLSALDGYATNNQIATFANVSDLTTSNVSEDTNLYFTNTRSISAFTAGENIGIDSNGLITANVTSSSGGSGVTQTVSSTAPEPSTSTEGDTWIDTDDGKQYMLVDDGNSKQWVEIGGTSYGLGGVYSNIAVNTLTVTNSILYSGYYIDKFYANVTGFGPVNNYDINTSTIFYHTGSSTANGYINIQGLNAVPVNNTVSVVVMLTNSGSPKFPLNFVRIDGTNANSVLWVNDTTPDVGFSGVNVYTYNILKTGIYTYTILSTRSYYG